MKTVAVICLALSLGACATAKTTTSGFLSSYDGLTPKPGTMRTNIRERADADALQRVKTVAIQPTLFGPDADVAWMTEAERAMILRELDAQLCFEVTERYELTPAERADALVRAAITHVERTGRAGSVVSAAADFFIPGPIGVRVPGGLGGLTAEAEMVDRDNRQLAAVTWARQANAVGTDNPSLSRIGDAMQFAEPFGDTVGATFAVKDAEKRKIESSADPCAQYGPRFRLEGFIGKVASGLYMPELSGAKDSEEVAPAPQEAPAP